MFNRKKKEINDNFDFEDLDVEQKKDPIVKNLRDEIKDKFNKPDESITVQREDIDPELDDFPEDLDEMRNSLKSTLYTNTTYEFRERFRLQAFNEKLENNLSSDELENFRIKTDGLSAAEKITAAYTALQSSVHNELLIKAMKDRDDQYEWKASETQKEKGTISKSQKDDIVAEIHSSTIKAAKKSYRKSLSNYVDELSPAEIVKLNKQDSKKDIEGTYAKIKPNVNWNSAISWDESLLA